MSDTAAPGDAPQVPAIVYLVDDYEDLIVVTEKLLEAERVDMVLKCFRSGEALLEALGGEIAPAPDLLIIDLNMPRMPGLELIERARAHPKCRHTVIGVCSGSTDPYDMERALAAGAAFYATKPLNRARVGEICRQLEGFQLVEVADGWTRLCREPAPGLARSRKGARAAPSSCG